MYLLPAFLSGSLGTTGRLCRQWRLKIFSPEQWSQRQLLLVTTVTGLAHTISTSLPGILVSLAGLQLAQHYYTLSEQVAPLLLAALGIWYLMQHLRHHHVRLT